VNNSLNNVNSNTIVVKFRLILTSITCLRAAAGIRSGRKNNTYCAVASLPRGVISTMPPCNFRTAMQKDSKYDEPYLRYEQVLVEENK